MSSPDIFEWTHHNANKLFLFVATLMAIDLLYRTQTQDATHCGRGAQFFEKQTVAVCHNTDTIYVYTDKGVFPVRGHQTWIKEDGSLVEIGYEDNGRCYVSFIKYEAPVGQLELNDPVRFLQADEHGVFFSDAAGRTIRYGSFSFDTQTAQTQTIYLPSFVPWEFRARCKPDQPSPFFAWIFMLAK